MIVLGLHYSIWIVLILYFAGMLVLGWFSKRHAGDSEGYLLGGRKFGTSMMVMHAFGAGTNPTDTTGCISKSVAAGASGIWVSWMWMFGTPFYWLIAPIMRRMRCLTMTDYFEERYGRGAAALYTLVAGLGMTIFFGGVLLATTKTVMGMMGVADGPESDAWFFGILTVTTAVFVLYGYWGGIVAAVRTDMIQGLMIIALSIIALWPALNLAGVGGMTGLREHLATASAQVDAAVGEALGEAKAGDYAGMAAVLEDAAGSQPHGTIRDVLAMAAWQEDGGSPADRARAMALLEKHDRAGYLSLFNEAHFSWGVVLLLCMTAPLTALALPHLMSVTAAGKTEWEGRLGFVGGNLLKRICTIGWSILALCWMAHLVARGAATSPDAAFGDAIRALLPPVLQGVMLACVLAASMSSGDAVQVTVAGLFTQSLYARYVNPAATDAQRVRFTRIAGVAVIAVSLAFAVLMRSDLVKSILLYFNVLAAVGISSALGILWRRMNQAGVFCGTIAAVAALVITRTLPGVPRTVVYGAFPAAGLLFGVLGSLVTRRPDRARIERFFTKIYTPVGQEDRLDLPLDQAVPKERRLLEAGGLFIVKPSRQSWVGFLVVLGICIGCLVTMLLLLRN